MNPRARFTKSSNIKNHPCKNCLLTSKDGAFARAPSYHQYGLSLSPGLGNLCGLSSPL